MLSSGRTEASASTASRPKRNQVGRACDWCRLNRIKCDDSQPCKNCQIRGCECVVRRKDARNLPSANREIARLRVRVAELENQIKRQEDPDYSAVKESFEIVSQSSNIDTLGNARLKRRHWEGVWTAESHTGQMQYYGPSSSFYFVNEIRSRLKSVLQREDLGFPSLPTTASKIFASPTSASRMDSPIQSSHLGDEHVAGENLTRPQEEDFLNMFWQLYHCTVPILDHGSFKEHYDSLWVDSETRGSYRKPSALVDVVLALSIQYGTSSMLYGQAEYDMGGEDSSVGGRWFYRRCQMLLLSEREKPSLFSMQCYIYSAVYLWNASFFNLAHETLATTIRAAHVLGFHHKSNSQLQKDEKCLSQRIWWVLYCLDTKACIDLGRPFSIHLSDVTCELPTDSFRDAMSGESHLQLIHDGMGYLEYHSQCVRLMLATQTIHTTFYNKCTELINKMDAKSLHDDPTAHETAANTLEERMTLFQEWTRSVPEGLKMSRKGNSEPFSASRSTLVIDTRVPLWLQRQRLFLELLYHNVAISFYRPFIQSSSSLVSLTPIADSCRHKCLHHAIITTSIIQQFLSETTILNGTYQVYQYQWEAVTVMLGFALFRPICPFASSTSKAIETGITNLETFGANNFESALSAANVARTMSERIETYQKGFQISLTRSFRTPSSSVETPRRDVSMDVSLHFSDDPGSLDPANKFRVSTGFDSQSDLLTAFKNLQTAPITAEVFAARMSAGMHSNDSLWLTEQNINPGILDANMEIWPNWMNDC